MSSMILCLLLQNNYYRLELSDISVLFMQGSTLSH